MNFALESPRRFLRLCCLAIFILLSVNISGAVVQKINRPNNSDGAEDSRAIYVPGSSSCGLWLELREHQQRANDARQIQFESFLLGYAAAYNYYVEGPRRDGVRNVLHIDVYGRRAFLDRYCHQHPTDVFVNAVNALLYDLDR